MQLSEYKVEFQERMLDLAWRQWVALGVKGYGEMWRFSPIDPEALIVFTCEVGRRDQRLFDGMVEWVEVNGRWINVSRAKRALRQNKVVSYKLFLALVERGDSTLMPKYKGLKSLSHEALQPEPLFVGENGEPVPTGRSLDPVFERWGFLRNRYENRKICGPFPAKGAETLFLRIRAFAGLNARAEILTYLLLHGSGSPRSMARFCGYGAPAVTRALAEMAESGWVDFQSDGRKIMYYLRSSEKWWDLLVGWKERPEAMDWMGIMPALCQIYQMFDWVSADDATPRQQASRVRRILESDTLDGLKRLAPGGPIGGKRMSTGEELIPEFIQQVERILDRMMRAQP